MYDIIHTLQLQNTSFKFKFNWEITLLATKLQDFIEVVNKIFFWIILAAEELHFNAVN